MEFFDNHLDQYSVFFGDYNNDNSKEIYVFTRTSDSLFLSIIDKNESNFTKTPILMCFR